MKILISAYTGLGNFILKTPMIHKIKEVWPEAEIDLIADNSYGTEYVLAGTELVNETHILKVDTPFTVKLKFFWSLREKRYDAVFLPFDAAPTFMMFGALLLGGTKYSHMNLYMHRNIKLKIRQFVFLFGFPGFRFVPLLQGRHETDLNYDLLEALYDRPMERNYQTFIAQHDDPAALSRFNIEPGRYIVIQPAAANGSLTAKVWAPRNFAELRRQLNQRYPDLKLVFVGDQGDLASIKQTSLVDIDDVVNTMGKTTIGELTSIINNAALVIAHDSGVMHIANALQANLIALYGPTDYTRTRPLAQTSHILFSTNGCLAAHYDPNVGERDLARKYPDYACMDGISVEDVMKKATELLVASRCQEKSIA